AVPTGFRSRLAFLEASWHDADLGFWFPLRGGFAKIPFMNTNPFYMALIVVAGLAGGGCESEPASVPRAAVKGRAATPAAKVRREGESTFAVAKESERQEKPAESQPAPPLPDPALPALPAGAKRVELRPGCAVFLDVLGEGKRRVLFRASVCQ